MCTSAYQKISSRICIGAMLVMVPKEEVPKYPNKRSTQINQLLNG